MKKSLFIGALCVLIILLAAACGGSPESVKSTVAPKEGAAPQSDEAYVLGDADGNGTVNINDATLIQHVICESVSDPDGKIALRGDVDGGGLSITDVTLIMRYLAEYNDDNGIGERVTPTAPATTAAVETTAQPTAAEEQTTAEAATTTAPPATTKPALTGPQPTTAPPTEESATEGLTLGENDLPFDIL